MRKPASRWKKYLRGKKLIKKCHLDFTLQDLQGEQLGVSKFDSILVENIPETLDKPFWEDLIHVCRTSLLPEGTLFLVLPRRGFMFPYDILRETEDTTIYSVKK